MPRFQLCKDSTHEVVKASDVKTDLLLDAGVFVPYGFYINDTLEVTELGWDDFETFIDDEGQACYRFRGVVMDEDDAGRLIDAANGHAAPTRMTDEILGR